MRSWFRVRQRLCHLSIVPYKYRWVHPIVGKALVLPLDLRLEKASVKRMYSKTKGWKILCGRILCFCFLLLLLLVFFRDQKRVCVCVCMILNRKKKIETKNFQCVFVDFRLTTSNWRRIEGVLSCYGGWYCASGGEITWIMLHRGEGCASHDLLLLYIYIYI